MLSLHPAREGVLTSISSENPFLALMEAASFYLITQKLNKRYSGQQEIASKNNTYIYNSRNIVDPIKNG